MSQPNWRGGTLGSRERLRTNLLLRLVPRFATLAEGEREGEEQEREGYHAAGCAVVVCEIWRDSSELGPSLGAPFF